MAQPSREQINEKVQESLDKYFQHNRYEMERSVRKALGLKNGDPLPASGGEFPKMVYHVDYLKATTEADRQANTDIVHSAEDEASLNDGWHNTLAKAKAAAEAAGIETKPAAEVKKARKK
jgi:hypothetical protein